MAHVAREMERQGFKLPLLIGGATTSRAHTAVKIAPHYSEPVVHVLDASRAVPVTTSLLSDEGKAAFVAQHRAEYEELRQLHGAPRQQAASRSRRRARTARRSSGGPRTCRAPEFTGVRVLDDFPLATLREFIDWTPFFHTWELKGVYPRILEHEKYGEQARQIFAEAQRAAGRDHRARSCSRARGVYGFFPANAVGDDVELYTDERAARCSSASTSCASRRAKDEASRAAAWPTSSRPSETGLPDHIGGFAVTTGIGLQGAVRRASRREHDDYNAIMAEALADRLAEAFAEYLHKRVRDEWGYGRDERPEHRGADRARSTAASAPPPAIPPAPTTPRRARCGSCSTCEKNTGMQLTESFAMWPGSSVSGLYFAHPQSRYFGARQDRPRPGRRLPRAQGHDRRRGRALARPQPRLRPRRRQRTRRLIFPPSPACGRGPG